MDYDKALYNSYKENWEVFFQTLLGLVPKGEESEDAFWDALEFLRD